MLQGRAQIVQLLAGQVRRTGHDGMTGLAMAGRAQAQPAGSRRCNGLAPRKGWHGGGQAQRRYQ
ncbi:hypothetical protein GCM10027065_04950 [Rhodanobacter koreensis]